MSRVIAVGLENGSAAILDNLAANTGVGAEQVAAELLTDALARSEEINRWRKHRHGRRGPCELCGETGLITYHRKVWRCSACMNDDQDLRDQLARDVGPQSPTGWNI